MDPAASPGILYSLRRLLETFVALVESRLELASVEWREEMVRASGLLLIGAMAAFAVAMAIIAVTALIIIVFWANVLWVLPAFAVFYLALAAFLWRALVRGLEKPFFVDTIAQLKKDRAWLTPGN